MNINLLNNIWFNDSFKGLWVSTSYNFAVGENLIMIQSLKKTAQALESIISKQINQRVTSVVRPQTIQREGNLIGRKEAVSLYSELVAHGLVTPSFVVIEQRKPDNHQLKNKGQLRFFFNKRICAIEKIDG